MSKAEGFDARVLEMILAAGSRRRLGAIISKRDATIMAWEGGSMPSDRTMRQIADATGIALGWLREGRGNTEQELATLRQLGTLPTVARSPSNAARGRLADALRGIGMTSAALAKRIGYSTGVVQCVVEGTARISKEMARRIAGELDLEAANLLSGADELLVVSEDGADETAGPPRKLNVPIGSKARYVPLLSWAQAGRLNAEHPDGGDSYKGVIATDVKDASAFAVEIRGTSMEPRIAEGDRALLTPGRETRAGDTVIARTTKGDVMCKLFQSKNDGQSIVLSSWNLAFPPVELRREEIAWICPVRQIVQNYGND
jgi:phage repressor protein C with HTH and peptisase S24 domain